MQFASSTAATRGPSKQRRRHHSMNCEVFVRALAAVLLATQIVLAAHPAAAQAAQRTVGVAFGGGSARGIAHIGVIQWFEENHIPIDAAAGTSMGGLVGGAFATGMSAAELRALITDTDWDVMFGSSSFPFKNLRRKEDARSYPSRLEFGVKKGIVPPTALNDGQQVDFLLARIAAPYYDLQRFDDLPTPFRVWPSISSRARRRSSTAGRSRRRCARRCRCRDLSAGRA